MLTYDGAQAVQARTWAGAVAWTAAWTAAWGPGVDHLVSVEKEDLEYFALDDGKGSVVGWLDGVSNQVVGRAEYTPEGLGRFVDEVAGTSCEEVDGARCPRPLDMPFGFHTAYASKTTGLLYFRNRWYSPEANLWLSQDPLDAVDSFDLYAFNGVDSVNFVDPWGLEAQSATTQGLREVGPGSKTVCSEDWNCWSTRILYGTLQDLRLTKARALAGDLVELAHDFSAAQQGAVFQFAVSMLPLPYPDPTRPAVPDVGDHRLPFHAGRFGGALGAGVVGAFELALAVTGGLAAVKGEVVSVGGIAAIPKTVEAAIAVGALGLATMAKGAKDAANAVGDYIKEKGNGSPAASPSSGDKPAGSTTPDGAARSHRPVQTPRQQPRRGATTPRPRRPQGAPMTRWGASEPCREPRQTTSPGTASDPTPRDDQWRASGSPSHARALMSGSGITCPASTTSWRLVCRGPCMSAVTGTRTLTAPGPDSASSAATFR